MMNDYIYCPDCECWIHDDFEENDQDPRCPHCGGELRSFDPDPAPYDTLEEKYL